MDPDRKLLVPVILAAASLCGCTPVQSGEPAPVPPEPPAHEDCGAGQLGGYVGHQATEEVIAALHEWRGEHPIRVVRPGMAVTMDYRPDRLNVILDENGTITRFDCT